MDTPSGGEQQEDNEQIWIDCDSTGFCRCRFYAWRDSDEPEPAPKPAAVARPAAKPEIKFAGPGIDSDLSPKVDSDFQIDPNRLYDITYETDPALVAFAEANDTTPKCLIDVLKRHLYGEPEHSDACDQVRQQQEQETNAMHVQVSEDHPYASYSDDELRSLATSSPEAALILARRLGFSEESEQWYERAVILSGKPGPLVEWLHSQSMGGLQFSNDVLEVESATVGYEVLLVVAKFGDAKDAVAMFSKALTDAGVDLAPIQARADQRFARLTQARQELVGEPWEGT